MKPRTIDLYPDEHTITLEEYRRLPNRRPVIDDPTYGPWGEAASCNIDDGDEKVA